MLGLHDREIYFVGLPKPIMPYAERKQFQLSVLGIQKNKPHFSSLIFYFKLDYETPQLFAIDRNFSIF